MAILLKAEIHGLEILRADCEDASYNTTRFVILSAKPDDADPGKGPCVTSLVFKVRNVPAALYKVLGGFATNGVNVTKLESYSIEGAFEATQFYADLAGHPDDIAVRRALEELAFFSASLNILGVYPAHPFRKAGA
jgi:prephenate dehydratase